MIGCWQRRHATLYTGGVSIQDWNGRDDFFRLRHRPHLPIRDLRECTCSQESGRPNEPLAIRGSRRSDDVLKNVPSRLRPGALDFDLPPRESIYFFGVTASDPAFPGYLTNNKQTHNPPQT